MAGSVAVDLLSQPSRFTSTAADRVRGACRVPAEIGELRRGLRETLLWLNRQRSLVALIRATRDVIPGDSSFGDPMSTTGISPAHALGRQAWRLQDGRLSLLAEATLAGLQLVDWIGEDVRGVAAADRQSILFVDLRGFSQWALRADDADVAELLRRVDAAVTEAIETRAGVVVKRLGDGAMAIFADCQPAVEAAFESISAVTEIQVGDYRPRLRAGVHRGQPYRIGRDYVGVDVNIAARLCEAAPSGGVLVSGQVRDELNEPWAPAPAPDIRLRGVPEHVSIYFAQGPDHRNQLANGDAADRNSRD
jgi:class 3 adenylate cyclase